MIIINDRVPDTVAPELLERLRNIPPATIGHVLSFGFMDTGLRPTGRRRFTICGPAFTVKTMATDSTVVHRAIDLAQPGDVLIIDRTQDNKHACWGEMTSLAAKVRGLAATVVDGPLTDVVEIEDMEYLVFSRGISPITTRSQAIFGEINTIVSCGGVAVAPGDIIHADDNGVLVLKPDQVADLVEHCEPIAQREPKTREVLRSGTPLSEYANARKKLEDAMAAEASH